MAAGFTSTAASMTVLLASLPLLLLIVLANWATIHGARARTAFNLLLFLVGLALVAVGLVVRFGLPGASGLPDMGGQWLGRDVNGLALAGIGAWVMLTSLRPVRRWAARLLPALVLDSSVHTLALAMAGLLAGSALLTTAPALETLAESGLRATLDQVLAQGLVFVLVAVVGTGLFLRRDAAGVADRLGLQRPTAGQLWTGVRWMVFFVFLQGCISVTWALLSPADAGALNSINQALLGDFDTVWEWFLLAAAAGLGEELFFRGALQPIFGIVPTSIIFAISHVQYGLSPATLTIFLLSLILGIIRKRSNTTVAILVHSGYNFIIGLLSLLALYLEPLTR